MKKIILAGIFLVLATACNVSPSQLQPAAGNPVNPTTTVPAAPAAPSTQTYSNSSYGFSFDYPQPFTFVTPTYGNLQTQVVQVQIDSTQYPKTNFGDAAFTVSVDAAQSSAACLALNNQPEFTGGGFTTQQTINGEAFSEGDAAGAGAGNLYKSKVYRTFHGSWCYELDETIHTSQIANYPAGTVTEIDTTAIQEQLDGILGSFTFTN